MKNNDLTNEKMTQIVGIRMTAPEKIAIDDFCNRRAMTVSKAARLLFSRLINGEISLNDGK